VLRPFALHQPSTIAEAAELLAHLGDDGILYAGGTEVLLLMKEGLLRVRHLIDVKRIASLNAIGVDGEWLSIGATATHREVERSPVVRARCPIVAEAARHVANVRVRNVGTVGGNLAFADPHSDLATLFLALDGVVRLGSARGTREVPIAQFVTGAYETARERDELLVSVRWRPWPPRAATAYVKFGIHERPTLGIALLLVLDGAGEGVVDARLAVGCVSPRPVRLAEAEDRLCRRSLPDLFREIHETANLAARGVDPITDLHGSAEYKREMVAVFVRRALRVAAARAVDQRPQDRYAHAVIV